MSGETEENLRDGCSDFLSQNRKCSQFGGFDCLSRNGVRSIQKAWFARWHGYQDI